MKKQSINISKELCNQFKQYCKKNNYVMSGLLESMIKNEIKNAPESVKTMTLEHAMKYHNVPFFDLATTGSAVTVEKEDGTTECMKIVLK